MKILFTFCLLLLAIPAVQAQVTNELEQYIEQRMEREAIPGMSIAFVASDGSVRYSNYGYADLEGMNPVTEKTLFEIGSITKTFTAVLLQALMEQQGIDGKTPVKQILGEPIPSIGDSLITLEHLATHHSGLPRLPYNMNPADPEDPYKDYTYDELYQFLNDFELEVSPDSVSFGYSNLGYMLLGRVIEILGEDSFDDLIQAYITGPLRMPLTARRVQDSANKAVPTSSGREVKSWNFDEIRGLGELHSNSKEMARYLKIFTELSDFPHQKAFKRSAKSVRRLNEDVSIGYSWFVNTAHEDTVIYHGGGTLGFRSFAGWNQQSREGVIILTNSTDDPQDIGMHLLNQNYELKSLREKVAVSADRLMRLEGVYNVAGLPHMTVTIENGELFAQLDGQPALLYDAINDTAFTNTSVQANLHFEKNGDESESVTLRQMGQEFVFTRTDEIPEPRKEIDLSEQILREYTGTYNSDALGLKMKITLNNNQLYAQLTGQPSIPVYAEEKDRFFLKVVDAQLEFQRDESGNVSAVDLHQLGVTRFDLESN